MHRARRSVCLACALAAIAFATVGMHAVHPLFHAHEDGCSHGCPPRHGHGAFPLALVQAHGHGHGPGLALALGAKHAPCPICQLLACTHKLAFRAPASPTVSSGVSRLVSRPVCESLLPVRMTFRAFQARAPPALP